jgi:hypothetical protein
MKTETEPVILFSPLLKDNGEEFILAGEKITVARHGVKATIIDFSLSRLKVPGGGVMFTNLRDMPRIFESFDDKKPEEPQWQVYRDMRSETG